MATCTVFLFLIVFNLYAFGFEEKPLNFVQIGNKYGYKVEEIIVITEDGYILKLFHIISVKSVKTPVLLMHGITDSADTWIIRGNNSLSLTLAANGYDVWVGNCRGNKYGRKHIYLDPDSDDFWDFSFHEFGYYDLSAIIDTVLYLTGSKKINLLGHSQGNAICYVLTSTRPEYNNKINILIALAPICFLQNLQPPVSKIIEVSPKLDRIAKLLNLQEVFGDNSLIVNILRKYCRIPFIGYKTCILDLLFSLSGDDIDEFEPSFVSTFVDHFPVGTSEKDLVHFAQVSLRRKFANYDYGIQRNIEIYNLTEPMEYNLSAVNIKVALLVGANDKLSTIEDVALLRERLPNVVKYLVIPRRKMNHFDFVSGLHMEDYLFPYIFDILNTDTYTEN
ncbi:PREDICTED: lipase 1-like [Papilio polytes]|uniref:lipase 1-like n=1 Tax=Papilio polytes TaxID=76194 RepID=UPI0006761FD4|nr:PREDICTED: lipase 1-like [Papilio polytes]